MGRSLGRMALALLVALVLPLSVQADYEAGQHAWDAGRTDEALTQWRAAADAGDQRAMLALGRLYVQGLGVLQDYVEAHKWLNLAASRGEAAALKERDALAEKMTPEERAEAQKLARAWRPGGGQAGVAAGVVRRDTEPATAPVSAWEGRPPPSAVRQAQSLLGALGYLRYVDDFALFHDDPERLEDWRCRIARFLEGRRLRLHPRKTVIVETKQPAEFLGFVLLPGGRRRLPEGNVRRFRNRLRGLRDRWRQGSVTRGEVERRVGAWVAHAEHANTRRLRRAIFRDGWFDPSRGPDRPPESAWCAAAPGTTNRGTSAPPTATGTPPQTGTTTTGSELPARSTARAGGLTGPPGARPSVQGRS